MILILFFDFFTLNYIIILALKISVFSKSRTIFRIVNICSVILITSTRFDRIERFFVIRISIFSFVKLFFSYKSILNFNRSISRDLLLLFVRVSLLAWYCSQKNAIASTNNNKFSLNSRRYNWYCVRFKSSWN